MSVHYTPYRGEMVSRQWKVVLEDMGNPSINEGHRTLARQTYFWNCYQCKCCNNGNLAAYPNSNAPHIRTGRADHAIDFPDYDTAMAKLSARGLKPTRPAGAGGPQWEPWHIEVSAGEMARFYEKHKPDKWEKLPDHVEKHVRALILHRHGAVATKGKQPVKYKHHVAWRTWHRKWLERALKRAEGATKKLIREALRVPR